MGAEKTSVALAAVKGVIGVIGAITTVAGIWSESLVVALNTVGVIGFGSAFVVAGMWSGIDTVQGVRQTAIAVGVTAVVISVLFFGFGRPLDEEESKFNLLTFMGIGSILAIAVLATMAWRVIQTAAEPSKKKCPDCANTVLAEARKCQYCAHVFS